MNTDTPETDASAWTETNWANACVTADFAQKLERERDEARETIAAALKALPVGYIPAHTPASIPGRIADLCKTIVDAEREIDYARAENGTWKKIASGRLSKIAEVTAQRDEAREALDRGLKENRELWFSNAELAEQRDKLAEALEELRNNESLSLGGAAYEIVEQALQSLTQNEL
jgi:hypothetical protein